jgi:PAS domain S-box-containing protein
MDELLNTAPCGFLSFGEDGRIELINATLLELLGYAADEVVGHHVDCILTVGTRIFYQTHWFPLLRMQERADEIFLMLRSKAGEEIGVLANAVRTQRRGRVAYDCVVMRVREREKYETELLRAKRAAEQARAALEAQARELERARAAAEAANEAKSAFLATMSHELRTPLNAISGYVQLLEMEIHGSVTDAQREALGRIQRSHQHLLRLINDVLNLARIEAGHVEYVITDVACADIIEEIRPMIEPQLAAKRLLFQTAVGPDQMVRADREKVQQIVLNLLSNAVKFTPPGGRISVSTAARDGAPDRVFLRVTDTGIGVPAEKLNTIFEPFVQVDESRSRRTEGTGLGLAISRDLACGMGGDLRARSVEGQGTTFTLTLPRAGELRDAGVTAQPEPMR